MKFKLLTYFKHLDLFGSGVNFTFNGESSYRSVSGAILSIVVFIVTLLQLEVKWKLFVERGDTKHSKWVEQIEDVSRIDKLDFQETNYNFAIAIVD